MTCTSPLAAYRDGAGAIHIANNKKEKNLERFHELQLPCGQCMDCKLERSRQWAVRMMHEAQLHESNYFVTLTYSDEHLPSPPELVHHHFQDFMKRLRRRFAIWDPTLGTWVPRYFMCGEYGEQLQRPHYHAAIFGLYLNDLVTYDNELKTSKQLDQIWGKGSCKIGNLTHESAQYIASYCTKKITGEKAGRHYTRVNMETGEIHEVTPEYARMSLNPAIALTWIQKYRDDVYNYDYVVTNGKQNKPPRYYDKVLQREDPLRHESLAPGRERRAQTRGGDRTEQALAARNANTLARMKLKKRTL